MKRMLLCLFALLAFAAQATFAQAYDNRLETIDQARQRQSAERWNEYQQRGYAPLGGYSSPLGDPAPYGTERPGYVTPNQVGPRGSGYGSNRNGYGPNQ